jgi:hypothetical protein
VQTPSLPGAPQLAPGQPNPADTLPTANPSVAPIGGKVTAVGSDSLTIAAQTPGNPMQGSSPGQGTTPTVVAVNAKTEIFRQGPKKDAQTFKKETEEFQAKMAYARQGVVYAAPDEYEHIEMKLSDIHIGDAVVVTPASPAASKPTAASVQVFPQSSQQ